MTDTSFWDERRNKVFSAIGGWKLGEGAYTRGINLLDGAVGKFSYMQVHILNVTGKLADRAVADWLEAVFIFQSWPDARIWCNQIGALGGEVECGETAAVAAGIQGACSEICGGKTVVKGCEFMHGAYAAYLSGSSVEDIVSAEVKRMKGKAEIPGYARPLVKGDERVQILWNYARKLGFEVGPIEKLALEIEAFLSEKYDERINMNGCVAAFMGDQGFSGQELYRIGASIVSSGIEACYIDNVDRPQGAFLPLRCDDIEYTGKPIRELPKT